MYIFLLDKHRINVPHIAAKYLEDFRGFTFFIPFRLKSEKLIYV